MLVTDPVTRSQMYGLDWTLSVILFCFKLVTEHTEDRSAFESIVVQLGLSGARNSAGPSSCQVSRLSTSQDVPGPRWTLTV